MARIPSILAVLAVLVLQPAPADAGSDPRPDDYVLRGKVHVLKATPYNPASKDLLFTKVYASVKRDPDGLTRMTLTHAWSGQSCRFVVKHDARGRMRLIAQDSCRFTALSSPGTLSVSDGVAYERRGRMHLESTMTIKWLNYTGRIRLVVDGAGKAVASNPTPTSVATAQVPKAPAPVAPARRR